MTIIGVETIAGGPAGARAAPIETPPHGLIGVLCWLEHKLAKLLLHEAQHIERYLVGAINKLGRVATILVEAPRAPAAGEDESLPKISVHVKRHQKKGLLVRSHLDLVNRGAVVSEPENFAETHDHKDMHAHLDRIAQKSHDWLKAHGM